MIVKQFETFEDALLAGYSIELGGGKYAYEERLAYKWPVPTTEQAYVAQNFKRMPDGWFPESLLILIRDGDSEVAHLVLPTDPPEVILHAIKNLKQAMWQHKENERLQQEWENLPEAKKE